MAENEIKIVFDANCLYCDEENNLNKVFNSNIEDVFNFIKINNDYFNSISDLLRLYTHNDIYYGVGLPINLRNKNKVDKNKDKVDFIINSDGEVVKIIYQVKNIF